jgi:octopine/nopaline transport system permease protein
MFELVGFGPNGWGPALIQAALTTFLLSAAGFLSGVALGALAAFARLSGNRFARGAAFAYSTLFRGVPDLLTVYLLNFWRQRRAHGDWRLVWHPGICWSSGFRHRSCGARGHFRRLSGGGLPGRLSRHPPRRARGGAGLWNVGIDYAAPRRRAPNVALRDPRPWQRLATVIGLVELMRQAQVGAGSTRQPFVFFCAAAALYLAIATSTNALFRRVERQSRRGFRTA